jgi:hypothetical protein
MVVVVGGVGGFEDSGNTLTGNTGKLRVVYTALYQTR